jgi:hypothetical protein
MGAEAERQALAAILREARLLLEDQRRAIAKADFADLLAIAHEFHRLAVRLSSLSPESLAPDTRQNLQDVREQIACLGQMLSVTLPATLSPARAYGRYPVTPPGSSLLVDHYG